MTTPLPLPEPGRWRNAAAPLLHPLRTIRDLVDDGPVLVLVLLFGLNGVDELTRSAFGVLAPDIAQHFGSGLAGIFTVLAFVAAVALGLQIPIVEPC